MNRNEIEFNDCALSAVWGAETNPLNNGGFAIEWSVKGKGFGEVVFVKKKDGSLVCDSEAMSPEFVEAVFRELIKRAKFID